MTDWEFDLTNRVRTILGRPIQIEEQLAEVPDPRFAEMQVLTLARYMDDNQEIMLKIRYELRPESFGIRDQAYLQTMRERADDDYLEEVKLVEDVAEIGNGPAYLAHVTQRAGDMFPYPDGTVNFIIMTRVSGENVARIFLTLSNEQLESIRKQLAFILEHMRQRMFVLAHQSPHFLRYDRLTDTLYIVDFSYMSFTNPNAPASNPITVDHMYVLGFDIWHRGEFEPGRRGGPSGTDRGFDSNAPSLRSGNTGGSGSSKRPQQGMYQDTSGENRPPLPR
ncbi:hypothetical protein CNMCM8980_005490 [Aspergillus fumigatiaffinis]|uniref:Protein kinase domain-containing protein n=1 Tax=Aspergillus fumigatiaffinis TaxID=340414 RepID=A0A8H4GM90_9EURO|nr:hypothetical protein CNMCM5878_005102 [Aspergillus fumigatiaffinis]KAF4224735.1 hypothetical protein CNMCM6457_008989 [Aspergillus fumigatiaffinis]KAF4228356.1 hypothetical protein CNMCM6805_002216 [Aspergillus fumigatiaffinis]KAF4251621.1 hypothetical protein CNMCM8980_005490 [Aspergillus fumigatiaffinis]